METLWHNFDLLSSAEAVPMSLSVQFQVFRRICLWWEYCCGLSERAMAPLVIFMISLHIFIHFPIKTCIGECMHDKGGGNRKSIVGCSDQTAPKITFITITDANMIYVNWHKSTEPIICTKKCTCEWRKVWGCHLRALELLRLGVILYYIRDIILVGYVGGYGQGKREAIGSQNEDYTYLATYRPPCCFFMPAFVYAKVMLLWLKSVSRTFYISWMTFSLPLWLNMTEHVSQSYQSNTHNDFRN